MVLTFFSPLDYLLYALTAVTLVLACITARRQAHTDKYAARISWLWATGLGLRLLFPVANQALYNLHGGTVQFNMFWEDNIPFLFFLVGIFLTLRRSRPVSQAEQDAA